MEFRKLGATDLNVSVIGMGCEHINPLSRAEAARIVAAALDNGITYFDLLGWVTATQDAFGDAFKGRRDGLTLVAHIGVGEQNGQYRQTEDPVESEEIFNSLLRRMGTDHVEIAQIGNIDGASKLQRVTGEGGLLDLAQKLKKQGKARFIGYSGHDTATARAAVEGGYLDVMLHPVSIVEDSLPGRKELLQLCADKGVGVAAMKTYAGGLVFQRDLPLTPAQCIEYSLSQPAVATVAVGFRSVEHVSAALAYLSASPEERAFEKQIPLVREKLRGMCNYCGHCMPCPSVIDIPKVMWFREAALNGASDNLRKDYEAMPGRPSNCVECGLCVERCPFGVDVQARIRETVGFYEKA